MGIGLNVFAKFFRFPKTLCLHIINELEPHDSQKSSIPFTIRFLAVLNFYSHGSYQKCVGNTYMIPMSQPSICRSIDEITKLLIRIKGTTVRFPQNFEEKLVIKSGFFRNVQIKGTIGAIDCTHINIISPPINDQQTPAHLYLDRKNSYSINVEAVSDYRLKFLHINAKYPGSCHDSGIWTTSPVRMHLIESYNTQNCTWLLGDSGYPLEPWLLTPLTGASTSKETKYNEIHIYARNVVERAFGVLKTRFRCLHKHRVLHYSHAKAANIVCACAILHNILIENSVALSEDDDHADVLLNEPTETNFANTQNFTEYFREGLRTRQSYINSL